MHRLAGEKIHPLFDGPPNSPLAPSSNQMNLFDN